MDVRYTETAGSAGCAGSVLYTLTGRVQFQFRMKVGIGNTPQTPQTPQTTRYQREETARSTRPQPSKGRLDCSLLGPEVSELRDLVGN